MRLSRRVPEYEASDEEATAFVREGYDAIAEHFAAIVNPPSHPRHAWLADLMQRLPKSADVLEIGSGSGRPTAEALTDAGHAVTGIDVSAEQVALARTNVPMATFTQADVLELSFPEASFDAVVAFYVLTHVPRRHYPELFARLRSWLRPGGWFLATFGKSDSAGWFEEDFLGFGGTSWTNSYDPATTTRLLEDAGFTLERADLVEQQEQWGSEGWLFVLAQRR